MKAVLVLVITWTVLVSEIVTTVQAASARGSRVSVTYVAPKDAAHQPIYEHLKELRFLEKLQEFLSPFQLPRILLVKVEGCDGNPDASYENDMIVVCYEYIDQLWKAIPLETTPGGVTAVDALVGPGRRPGPRARRRGAGAGARPAGRPVRPVPRTAS